MKSARLLCRHVLQVSKLARRPALTPLHPLAAQYALLFDSGNRRRVLACPQCATARARLILRVANDDPSCRARPARCGLMIPLEPGSDVKMRAQCRRRLGLIIRPYPSGGSNDGPVCSEDSGRAVVPASCCRALMDFFASQTFKSRRLITPATNGIIRSKANVIRNTVTAMSIQPRSCDQCQIVTFHRQFAALPTIMIAVAARSRNSNVAQKCI
jgi:hypothetical protein